MVGLTGCQRVDTRRRLAVRAKLNVNWILSGGMTRDPFCQPGLHASSKFDA